MQDIALRISQLRKESKLSQEALAEKTGVSRQAVSKWERGESSPDTENLITLSRIFGVTLDELLNGKTKTEELPQSALEEEKTELGESEALVKTADENSFSEESKGSAEIIKTEKPKKSKKPERVKKIKKARLFPKVHSALLKLPVIIIVPLVFVLLGVFGGVWSPAWLVNLLIPIYYGFVHAFGARTKKSFLLRLPVFLITVTVFITIGFLWGKWHPAWMVFFIDLIYYWVALSVKKDK